MAVYTIIRVYEVPAATQQQATDRPPTARVLLSTACGCLAHGPPVSSDFPIGTDPVIWVAPASSNRATARS